MTVLDDPYTVARDARTKAQEAPECKDSNELRSILGAKALLNALLDAVSYDDRLEEGPASDLLMGDEDVFMELLVLRDREPTTFLRQMNRLRTRTKHGFVGRLEKALASMEREVNVPPERKPLALDGQPLLVKQPNKKVWFVKMGNVYHLIDGDHVHGEMQRAFPDLQLHIGKRPMTPQEMWAAYGTRTDNVTYSMLADVGAFTPNDSGGGTLRIPACRRDPRVRPVFSKDVDEWLRRLTHEPDRLLDWLACSLQLDSPICALYLQGGDSVGKGMLAGGLSKIFGGNVVPFPDAVARFNFPLAQSPIVFLDERTPRLPNGSATFRTLVGESVHRLERKGVDQLSLEGCLRLIIAANNPDALRLSEEDLEPEDEEAIGIRILHLMVRKDTREWLGKKGGRQGFTKHWVDMPDKSPGELCHHIAWLAENRRVEPGSRFLVHGDARYWLRSLALREGPVQRILAAIAYALSGRDLIGRFVEGDERQLPRPCSYHNDKVFVAAGNLALGWRELTGERGPAANSIGRHLKKLRPNGPKSRSKAPASGPLSRVNGRWVDADLVLSVAERLGIGDLEKMRARLANAHKSCTVTYPSPQDGYRNSEPVSGSRFDD